MVKMRAIREPMDRPWWSEIMGFVRLLGGGHGSDPTMADMTADQYTTEQIRSGEAKPAWGNDAIGYDKGASYRFEEGRIPEDARERIDEKRKAKIEEMRSSLAPEVNINITATTGATTAPDGAVMPTGESMNAAVVAITKVRDDVLWLEQSMRDGGLGSELNRNAAGKGSAQEAIT